jgi:hypothetical protein
MKNQTLLPPLGMVLDSVSVDEKKLGFFTQPHREGQGQEQGLDEASTDEDRAMNASPTGTDGTGQGHRDRDRDRLGPACRRQDCKSRCLPQQKFSCVLLLMSSSDLDHNNIVHFFI